MVLPMWEQRHLHALLTCYLLALVDVTNENHGYVASKMPKSVPNFQQLSNSVFTYMKTKRSNKDSVSSSGRSKCDSCDTRESSFFVKQTYFKQFFVCTNFDASSSHGPVESKS